MYLKSVVKNKRLKTAFFIYLVFTPLPGAPCVGTKCVYVLALPLGIEKLLSKFG